MQRKLLSAFFLKLRILKIRLLVTWLKCLLLVAAANRFKPYSASISLNWHSCFSLQSLIFLNFFNYYCCYCFLLNSFLEYSNIFQWSQFSMASHYDISDVTTFSHFFVTLHFELFVRKDDNVCNKLDEMFIINIWYFVFIRVLLFRVNIRPRNNRNDTVNLNWC